MERAKVLSDLVSGQEWLKLWRNNGGKMNSPIEQEWQDFRQRILVPIDAGHTQTIECRRAFFAGAICLFYMLSDKAEQLPEEIAMKYFDSIQAEIKQYAKDLAQGKA